MQIREVLNHSMQIREVSKGGMLSPTLFLVYIDEIATFAKTRL